MFDYYLRGWFFLPGNDSEKYKRPLSAENCKETASFDVLSLCSMKTRCRSLIPDSYYIHASGGKVHSAPRADSGVLPAKSEERFGSRAHVVPPPEVTCWRTNLQKGPF